MKKYIKLTLENGMNVWVHKASVLYLHDDNSQPKTRSFIYFAGRIDPLIVREHSMGLKDRFEECP